MVKDVMLKGNPTDRTIYFDCDDTLVMWRNPDMPSKDKLKFKDPYTDTIFHLIPHKKQIQYLKDKYNEGFNIVVWSAATKKWAEEVVRVLNLGKYVSAILSKPEEHVDDLDCSEWIGNKKYIPFDINNN